MDSKENEWVLNKAKVKRELLDTVKARKLAYYGHSHHELPGEMQGITMRGACTQTTEARKTMHARHG